MTTEQMLEDCKEQMKKIVDEIRELESQINSKKEQYFRLQGAIEALNVTKNQVEQPSTEVVSAE